MAGKFNTDQGRLSSTAVSIECAATVSAEFVQVLEYWRSLRRNRWAPKVEEFKHAFIPGKLLPWLTVVRVEPGERPDFIYEHWGEGCQKLYRQDLLGKSIDVFRPGVMAKRLQRQYKAAMNDREPRMFAETFAPKDGGGPARFASIRLPFSADGETVAAMAGFTQFFRYRDNFANLFEPLSGAGASQRQKNWR